MHMYAQYGAFTQGKNTYGQTWRLTRERPFAQGGVCLRTNGSLV